jgi:multiple sugar transport system permease protein
MNFHSKRSIDFRKALSYALLLLACIVTIFPLVYMIGTAFKGPTHVFEFPPRFIPSDPTLENFISAWQSNQFDRYFINSVLVTVLSTGFVVFIAGLMSFAFAYLEFWGRRIIFSLIMLFMTMPVMILIIPQFELANLFNLIDSLQGLIVVYIAQNIPLATFILTGFFKQLPKELLEAASIDGANAWGMFWKIVLPLSKPALATVTIFASLGAWDEFVWANTIINTSYKRTLPVGIAAFQGVQASNWGLIFAASLIAIAPIILIFIILQRYFIKGAISGAIKG